MRVEPLVADDGAAEAPPKKLRGVVLSTVADSRSIVFFFSSSQQNRILREIKIQCHCVRKLMFLNRKVAAWLLAIVGYLHKLASNYQMDIWKLE